ncbi:MAG: nitrilase-related carbon-nitrogen hydrolase [Candidatus Thorarchaeota archaeon]
MKIGYVQTSPIFGEKNKNFEQVEDLVSKIKADLIVLPELFATGYTFISKEEAYTLGEDLNGETAEFLKILAKKTGAVIVAGFIEKKEGDIFNSAMIMSNRGLYESYRKLHLYFKEKLWFKPGNRKFHLVELKGMKIGIMICFDWIFPESVRTLALLGADIIAHPANLVLPYCQNAMITRCLENRVYAVTANRIGSVTRGSDSFTFTGRSQITSYNGEILSSAPANEIFAEFIEIDIKRPRNKNLNEYNNLFDDRRSNFYLK